jgi:NADPH:quinone reductase-like Zn-dependent oxidoreductase
MTTPTTMRAAICEGYGPPQTIHIEEVPVPRPRESELLVRVRAATVNRTDCGYRGAKPFIIRFFSGLRRPRRPVLGTEFAGEVVAVGDTVTKFSVGDRICGWSEPAFGGHGEYLTIDEDRLIVPIPPGRSFEQAAPSMEGSHYALPSFRWTGVKAGDDVLIYGATGAIGSAAVQLAKSWGLTVTAVCGTEHLDLVKGLGADRVIDYQTTDFTKDTQQYDLVIDAVGKSSFRRCRRLLKPRGIYESSDVGFMWHGPLLALITPLFKGRRVMFFTPRRDPEGIRWLKGLIASGEFTPVIDRSYPFDQIVEAYRYVETGQKIGNVVITMA